MLYSKCNFRPLIEFVKNSCFVAESLRNSSLCNEGAKCHVIARERVVATATATITGTRRTNLNIWTLSMRKVHTFDHAFQSMTSAAITSLINTIQLILTRLILLIYSTKATVNHYTSSLFWIWLNLKLLLNFDWILNYYLHYEAMFEMYRSATRVKSGCSILAHYVPYKQTTYTTRILFPLHPSPYGIYYFPIVQKTVLYYFILNRNVSK